MNYKVGDKIQVKINKIQDNGCFCTFWDNSDNFGFLSKKLATTFCDKDGNFKISRNDTISVYIHTISEKGFLLSDIEAIRPQLDKIRKRNEIEEKQRKKKQIDSFVSTYKPGTIFEAEVIKIYDYQVNIRVGNVFGIITKENLNWNGIDHLNSSIFENEVISVVYVNHEKGKLFFSTKLLKEKPYDENLYDLSLEELLKFIGHQSNTFIGQAKLYGNFMFIDNLYSCYEPQKGKLLVDPIYGYNLRALVLNANFGVEENLFYKIKLQLSNKEKRLERNQLFQFYATNIEETNNPFKNDVHLAFQRNTTNPSSNQRDAKLLEEIGKNMYSSKERMFFELVQNADDAASQNGVVINVDTKDNYLLLRHNGFSFDKDDFVSITTAANGTKKANENKTGYKGIGFKSVFTDSEQVFIKTGGYQFKFDKSEPIFKDFDKFYLENNPMIMNEESRKRFLSLYLDYKKVFDGIHSIPWQLEPIWIDNYPEELGYNFTQSNVAIALKLGENKILGDNGYQKAIDQIIDNPKFMLFLRNTKRIDFNGKSVSKSINNNRIILKNSFSANKIEYFERIDYPIDINNEVFKKYGIDIRIQIDEQNEETGAIMEAKFVDLHNQELENIPKKIAINNGTTISFAVSLTENGELMPNIKCSDISMFAFLPTLVKDFKFPFYINANFILDPPRQRILGDNPWNFYLMQEIARCLVKWCASLNEKGDKNALNILVSGYYEENTADTKLLAKHFNTAYKTALQSEAFILNHKGELAKQDEIILDNTCLSKIVGPDLFCQLMNPNKFLPSEQIDSKILFKGIFDKIVHYDFDVIINALIHSSSFNGWFVTASEDDKQQIYKWITNYDNSIRHQKIRDFCSVLPLFNFGQLFMSQVNLASTDYIVTTDRIAEIKVILTKIGIQCTNNVFNEKHYLYKYLDISSEKKVFKLIKECDFSQLDISERKTLFFALKEFVGVGEAKIKDIALFRNLNGEFKPLDQMAVYKDCAPIWLRPWIISNEDYCKEFDKYLISNENVFSDVITNHLSDFKDVSLSDLYETFDAHWTATFTKHLIDIYGATEQLLDIVERTDGAKEYFIKKYGNIYLPKPKDSVDYRVVKMALSDDIPIKKQIIVNEQPLSDYTISDDVTISIIDKSFVFSLSELLPEYQDTSGMLNTVKQLLSDINGYETLLATSPMSNLEIWNTISKMNNKNEAQIAFYICYNYKFNYHYTLSFTDDEFVSVMNYCYQHSINVLSHYMQYITAPIIVGKFIHSDSYTLSEEQLSVSIGNWADDEDKQRFLISLGVKSDKSEDIKLRKSFLNNEKIYLGDVSNNEINAFLNWCSTLSTPFTNENQVDILQEMFKRINLSTEYSASDYQCADEWDNGKYRKYVQSKLSIKCLNSQMPKRGIFKDTHLFTEYEGDARYSMHSKTLYVNNSDNGIEKILLAVCDNPIIPFSKDDWTKLFMVSQSDYDKLQSDLKDLREKLARLGKDNSSEVEEHGRDSGKGSLDEATRKSINRQARIAAKEFLERYEDYNVSEWEPETSGQIVKDIITYKGEPITVVITSSRANKLYLHPRVFAELMVQPDNLLLNYGKDGEIHSLSFDRIFKNNPNVNLIFDADIIDSKEFAKLANRYIYSRKTCFVVENPNYSASDVIESFGLEETIDDGEVLTDFSDEDYFNFNA